MNAGCVEVEVRRGMVRRCPSVGGVDVGVLAIMADEVVVA